LQDFNTIRETEAGYLIVSDLLQRQDTVIDELDQLNARIEAMIRELSAQRAKASGSLSEPVQQQAA
jgi:hypothetical protein